MAKKKVRKRLCEQKKKNHHGHRQFEEGFISRCRAIREHSQRGMIASSYPNSMEAIVACHPALSTEWPAGWTFRVTVIHFYFGADLISVISVQAFFT